MRYCIRQNFPNPIFLTSARIILRPMEFEASYQQEKYQFSFLDHRTVLVSGRQVEYILYKKKDWHCADEMTLPLLKWLNEVIEKHTAVLQ